MHSTCGQSPFLSRVPARNSQQDMENLIALETSLNVLQRIPFIGKNYIG